MKRKLEWFPDRPLHRRDLRIFDEEENIEILAIESELLTPIAHTIALKVEDWYYVIGYETGRGWEILERLDGSTPNGRKKIQSIFDDWIDGDPVRTDRPF